MGTQASYQADQLEKCKTDAQRKEADRLIGLGKTVYVGKGQGKSVVAQFRRYVEKRDPEQIGDALYYLMIQGSGGFNDIAHFNLYGFRDVYPHPTLMLEQLIFPEVKRWPDHFSDPDSYHSFYVYTDGVHAGQVARQIVDIAAANRRELARDFMAIHQAAEKAELERLAAKLGATVTFDDANLEDRS